MQDHGAKPEPIIGVSFITTSGKILFEQAIQAANAEAALAIGARLYFGQEDVQVIHMYHNVYFFPTFGIGALVYLTAVLFNGKVGQKKEKHQ